MELANFNKDRKKRAASVDLSAMVYGKVPPQAKELEESVLGTILTEPNYFETAAEIIKPECFYVDAYQIIFSAFTRLNDRGVKSDILSTAEELKKTEELDIVGGPYALTALTNKTSSNIEDNCRIIKEKFISRELIRISGETIGEAYEDSADAFDIMDGHETKLLSLSSGFLKGNFLTAETISIKAMERIDFLMENRQQLSGVPTGFKSLDRLTNGWQETDLIILAARPSVGKTAFALNLAINAVKSRIKQTPVAFFSLEMSCGQLANRMFASESGVHLEKISRGKFWGDEYDRVMKAGLNIGGLPLYVDDTASLNVFEFRAKARRLVNKHKVGLIIIDYLQLMSGINAVKGGNREQEISNISRTLKATAKQLNVPIIALSQLSRAIESRKEKPEPQLSDLRESGAIEQDADMVIFLYRPDYQLSADEIDPSISGQAMAKIAKHRNGSLDKIPFKTDLSIQKWYDADFDQPAEVVKSNLKPLPRNYTKPNEGQFDDNYDEATPF